MKKEDSIIEKPFISYKDFVPDAPAEASVVQALTRYKETGIRQGWLSEDVQPDSSVSTFSAQGKREALPAEMLAGLRAPDPQFVYHHAASFCKNHFMMLHAAENDCAALFRLRIEGLNIQDDKECYLLNAARMNAASVVRDLIAKDVNVNACDEQDTHRHTALHWAVYQKAQDAFDALLEAPQLDIEARDSHGTTALEIALQHLYFELAERLLHAGASLSDDMLVWAAGKRNLLLVNLIIRHAADLNVISKKYGITPLHAAIAAKGVEETQRLLLAGADPALRSRKKFKKSGNSFPGKLSAAGYAEIVGMTL